MRTCLLAYGPVLIIGFMVAVGAVTPGFGSQSAVDHGLYGELLRAHVQGGFFNYRTFHQTPSQVDKLDRYLDRMSRVDPATLSGNQQLAYWINLYNAATLRLIDRNYPLDSIKDVGGWFSSPWSISFVRVGSRSLTLDQIEHEIIRVRFDEPRIHFALVCAARSCPPLRGEPYVGSRLDRQLEDQTQLFLNSSKNRFRMEGGRVILQLSSIFSWYGEDFGGREGIVRFLKPHLNEAARARIEEGRYRVQYLDYDWSLNQAPGPYPSTS